MTLRRHSKFAWTDEQTGGAHNAAYSCVCLYAGRHHVGKVVYTDYEQVLIWYECAAVDVSGACAFSRSR